MTSPERRNGPTLEYAYDIEGHSIAISAAQAKGELVKTFYISGKITKHLEAGLDWYVLEGGYTFYAGNCNEELMQGLIHGQKLQTLHIMRSLTARPDVFWGRNMVIIAAVLLQDRDRSVLYKSPGFNLEKWREGRTGDGCKCSQIR